MVQKTVMTTCWKTGIAMLNDSYFRSDAVNTSMFVQFDKDYISWSYREKRCLLHGWSFLVSNTTNLISRYNICNYVSCVTLPVHPFILSNALENEFYTINELIVKISFYCFSMLVIVQYQPQRYQSVLPKRKKTIAEQWDYKNDE